MQREKGEGRDGGWRYVRGGGVSEGRQCIGLGKEGKSGKRREGGERC